MNKAYERINWENSPSTETPLNEDNLNKIDLAVDILDDRILDLDSLKFDKSNAQKLVKSVSFNQENGKITITYYDGSKDIIETFLEDADVIELQDNLIKHHAVVQKILDSDGNPLLDSAGNEIYGKTVYADQTDIVSIYNSLSAVKNYLTSLNAARPLSRLTEEEKKSEEMAADIAGLEQRITELETRMQTVEAAENSISASIEALNHSISTLSTSIDGIMQRLDSMDTYFAGFERNLAMNQLVMLPLQDSAGAALLDSAGQQISSRSIFATQSSTLDVERKLAAISDYTQSLNQFRVKSRIEEEERKSAAAQDSIDALNAETASLQQADVTLNSSITSLAAETEALRQADVALNSSISALDTEQQELSQTVQAIDQDLDDVSLQVADNIVDFAQFKDTLAIQRTITLDLQDSSNEPLLDSAGYAVQARTVYAEQGQIIDIMNNLSAVERQLDGINRSGVANRMTRAEAALNELNDHAILDNII